jgi:hypothetical protein
MPNAATIVDQSNEAAGAGEVVAFTSTSGQSAALPTGTKNVRVVLSTAGFIEIGTDPTAVVTTSFYLPAGVIEYFSAKAGQKVAVIRQTSDGSAYIRGVK